MSDIVLRSDIVSRPVDHYGGDWLFVDAARTSSTIQSGERGGERPIASRKDVGLIRSLIIKRHGSPFKHGGMTFYVEAPIFVFRELRTHFVGNYQIEVGKGEISWFGIREGFEELSYSEASGRYRPFQPEFWIPEPGRPMFVPEKFRPMAPQLEVGSEADRENIVEELRRTYEAEWYTYRRLLDMGVAPEVARASLGIAVYSAMYMSLNPLSALRLMTLRVNSPDSRYPTYPQLETQRVVEPIEYAFSSWFPVTYEAFVENGRVAP